MFKNSISSSNLQKKVLQNETPSQEKYKQFELAAASRTASTWIAIMRRCKLY